MQINFESLWKRFSSDSRFSVDEVKCSDGVTPNQIIRIPKGVLKVNVGDFGYVGADGSDGVRNYSNVVCLSRHFVKKQIYRIDTNTGRFVKTTADHTCMRVKKDEFRCPVCDDESNFMFDRVSAKDLRVGDFVCISDSDDSLPYCADTFDTIDTVVSVSVDDNSEGMWVYDLEVDSKNHVYFANGILVHNSQFINLSPVTKCKCEEDGVDVTTGFEQLPPATKKKVMDEAYHILDLANANVEKLVNKECHTSQGNILHYSLEYIAAEGMYFKKKHYIVRKIISDDLPCNKFKYSGISVKKAEIPVKMKDFLKNIFESTMTKKWTEVDYRKEVERAFNTFVTLDWGDISYYKKYRTVKRTISLTESEKGAGVHARAANFYNQLIEKLGLAGRYPKIGVGDEFRYSYVLPTNEYNMNCIAFKGQFPDEFRTIFKPDYETMFEKIFTKSLEHYIEIMGFKKADPTKQEESPEFSLF